MSRPGNDSGGTWLVAVAKLVKRPVLEFDAGFSGDILLTGGAPRTGLLRGLFLGEGKGDGVLLKARSVPFLTIASTLIGVFLSCDEQSESLFMTLKMAAELAADDVTYERIGGGHRCTVNTLRSSPLLAAPHLPVKNMFFVVQGEGGLG